MPHFLGKGDRPCPRESRDVGQSKEVCPLFPEMRHVPVLTGPEGVDTPLIQLYSNTVQVWRPFLMANRTTYTRARATLASLCDRVAETREPYVIERRNGENVALISEAELNSLLETAHLLRSPKNASKRSPIAFVSRP